MSLFRAVSFEGMTAASLQWNHVYDDDDDDDDDRDDDDADFMKYNVPLPNYLNG